MQLNGTTANDVLVMDDYAHHPSEIRATLKAVRDIYPEKRLVVVYQPHRFTRTAKFAPQIASVLGAADCAYVLPVFSAGEKEDVHGSSEEIVKLSEGKIRPADFESLPQILRENLRSGDLLLTMGAGDVYTLGENFLNDSKIV